MWHALGRPTRGNSSSSWSCCSDWRSTRGASSRKSVGQAAKPQMQQQQAPCRSGMQSHQANPHTACHAAHGTLPQASCRSSSSWGPCQVHLAPQSPSTGTQILQASSCLPWPCTSCIRPTAATRTGARRHRSCHPYRWPPQCMARTGRSLLRGAAAGRRILLAGSHGIVHPAPAAPHSPQQLQQQQLVAAQQPAPHLQRRQRQHGAAAPAAAAVLQSSSLRAGSWPLGRLAAPPGSRQTQRWQQQKPAAPAAGV